MRVETAKGGNRRGSGAAPFGGAGREATPGFPALSAGVKRSWGVQLARTGSPGLPRSLRAAEAPPGRAGLRCAGTGRRREGSVRGSEAAAGNRTYVPSACWRRRCAELASQGTLGPSGASHRAARAGQGRAGPGRAGLRAASCAAGVYPSLAARAGPSSRSRAQANGAPSPPTRRLPRPRGWPPGGRGRGVGATGLRGSPAEAFLGTACGGRAQAPGEGAGESPRRKTFLASSDDCAPFVRLSTPP